ncbi:hypothetical protein JG688_00006422, partial [Phytophthora aleatoria]
ASTYCWWKRRTDRHQDVCYRGSIKPRQHQFLRRRSHLSDPSPHCVTLREPRHSLGGNWIPLPQRQSGREHIRVLFVMNHPSYSQNSDNTNYTNHFAVLELETPRKSKPVKLAAPDDSDFKAEKWVVSMGWVSISEVNITYSYELTTIGSSVLNRDSCFGDSGGSLIPEGPETTEDVLIGFVSWGIGDSCGRDGYPGIYSGVSNA